MNRLPLGTPRNGGSPHCHIRVVPRADDAPRQTYDGDSSTATPVFRSQSLLCPTSKTSNRHTPVSHDPTVETFPQVRTFADMARRIGVEVTDDRNKPMAQKSPSSAGVIKFQPNHTRVNKAWRPLQVSDKNEPSGTGLGGDNNFSTAECVARFRSHGNTPCPSSLAPFPCRPSQDGLMGGIVVSSPLGQGGLTVRDEEPVETIIDRLGTGYERRPAAVQHAVSYQRNEPCEKLPDPMHLRGQLGEFNGQVLFVAHPNRDVSAHQWSSATFQWEDIGRCSQARGDIKASLTSEHPKKNDDSHSALECFKLAAQNRENPVLENCGLYKTASDSIQPTLPTILRAIESPADTIVPAAGSYFDSRSGSSDLSQPLTTTSIPLHTQVKEEPLDDPSLANTNHFEAVIPRRVQSGNQVVDAKGSLDLEYQFPVRTGALSVPSSTMTIATTTGERHLRCGREIQASGRCVSNTPGQVPVSILQDVNVGEEASSGRALRDFRIPIPTYTERGQLQHAPAQHSATVLRCGTIQATARSLFPPHGLTVANPHRDRCRRGLAAMAHGNEFIQVGSPGSSGTDTTAVTGNYSAALRFSDPDSIRQVQEHEIVNGSSRQAPTVQNFKGPFFTESQPTAHNPTALLSFQISENEKLLTWFRDGHRPARQREHAASLVSAEIAGGKSQCFEAKGKTTRVTQQSYFENTTLFVRLYEGLSEYVEEYRNGRSGDGGSYFTRAWKVGPSHMRDFDIGGNESYFTDDNVLSSRVLGHANRSIREP